MLDEEDDDLPVPPDCHELVLEALARGSAEGVEGLVHQQQLGIGPERPGGSAFASRIFRAVVPDLSLTVEKLIVEGSHVTVHMVFAGRFTGFRGTVHGTHQAIRSVATDLLKITDRKVTDHWHIEDNFTFLRQMGVAKLTM